MKSTKYYKPGGNDKIPGSVVESVIRVAYGDAGLWEKMKVIYLAKSDNKIADLLNEYRQTARSVKSIKMEDCPDELLLRISGNTEYEYSPKPSVMFDIYSAIFTKPIVSAAAISVVVLVIVLSVSFNISRTYDGYEKAEVELANRQAKYALAVINKVFTSTSSSLAKDILTEKVSKPINEGIETVNKLFKGDEVKNEN
jgi:hypothetical protein